MPERLLRRREVEKRVGLVTSRIYALMKEGRFPRPVRISKMCVAWRESEIEDWMAGLPPAGPEPQIAPTPVE